MSVLDFLSTPPAEDTTGKFAGEEYGVDSMRDLYYDDTPEVLLPEEVGTSTSPYDFGEDVVGSPFDIPKTVEEPFLDSYKLNPGEDERDYFSPPAEDNNLRIIGGDAAATLMDLENDAQVGYDFSTEKWYPHSSVEGGTDTLGYGHKLSKKELKDGVIIDGDRISVEEGLTQEQIESLFYQDVEKARRKVGNKIKDFEEFDYEYQDLLTLLEFNTGDVSEKKWPKLLKAIRIGDRESVRNEMLTHYKNAKGEMVPLESRRDKTFEELF